MKSPLSQLLDDIYVCYIMSIFHQDIVSFVQGYHNYSFVADIL